MLMRLAPRSRWIGWLAMLAFLAAGLLTPWLEGVGAAQAMAMATEPAPCHEPSKDPGCATQIVCVAKCLQGPMLAAVSSVGVSVRAAVFDLAPSPATPARVIQPQPPPPRL